MFCPNCGNEVQPGQAFCGNCGFRLEAGERPVSVRPEVTAQDAVTVHLEAVERPAQPATEPAQPAQPAPAQAANPVPAQAAADPYVAAAEPAAGATAPGARHAYGTGDIVTLAGKAVALLSLIMPCVTSPLIKLTASAMGSSSSPIAYLMGGASPDALRMLSLFRGSWNMPELRGTVSQLNRLAGLMAGAGDVDLTTAGVLSKIGTLNAVVTVAFVVWALMLVALCFCIVRPFLKVAGNDRLRALEGAVDLQKVLMVGVGALSLLWCACVIFANGQIESLAAGVGGSQVGQALALAKPLELTSWPWVAGIASLLTAFWPQLSRRLGLAS
ncbi:zinc ribbon domain-containing protein [uncultured Olsenella sp.]|mgnify:CR=1 FL=1|uniref:zinc ribbon domain-containing protein n=2 Tax=Olsenella TaxID=133925 RepID=UPI0026DD8074|nr:zinc-ribbon domain-containing protein [uncultured Olsenella sp.]